MWGPTGALLLLLPISHEALVSRNTSLGHDGHDVVGRMLRGPSESADLAAGRDGGRKIVGSKGTRHTSENGSSAAPGHLQLSATCYMTEDCSPGLFTVSESR